VAAQDHLGADADETVVVVVVVGAGGWSAGASGTNLTDWASLRSSQETHKTRTTMKISNKTFFNLIFHPDNYFCY